MTPITPDQSDSPIVRAPMLPRAFAFLAPAALVFPVLFALSAVTLDKNETYEWLQHRGVAVGFAAAFASVLLWGPWRQGWPAFAGAVVALGTVALGVRAGLPGMHGVIVAAGGLVTVGYRYASRRESPSLLESIAVGSASVLCFWAVSRLVWWQPFDAIFSSWPNQLLLLASTALLVGLLCRFEEQVLPAGSRRWGNRLFDAFVLLLLAAAVMRTNGLPGNADFPHHWGVYILPADLVRAGHPLLGEVPSQYGFLSTLVLAVIPAADRFAALYWLHCSLVWLSGGIIYFTLRTWLARWWWQLAAGLITVSCVAFLCGDASSLVGCLIFPSVGALRFIWVHALLGFLLWHHLRWEKTNPTHAALRRMLLLGSALWLLGVLWSVESAAYVTAVWLPAAALLAMPAIHESSRWTARVETFFSGVARSLSLAGMLLGIGLLFITGCYYLFLGRAPEWSAYWEYATAFSKGFGALPIEAHGGVWVLVLLHCTLLAALVSCDLVRRRSAAALVWGAWGALWAVSTYFISRSHTNNIVNLTPVLLLVLGVSVHAMRTAGPQNFARPWLWLSVPPFIGGMLWLVLSNPTALKRQLQEYAVEPDVARLLPAPPLSLTELLELCQQRQPAPYAVIDQASYHWGTGKGRPPQPNWLPVGSNPLFAPLPAERRRFYLDALHRAEPGWLLFPVEANGPEFAWIHEYAQTRYRLEATIDHDDWRAWLLVPREN